MATGAASAKQAGPKNGVKITGKSGMSPDSVKEDVQAINKHDGAKALASRIKEETGFNVDDEFAVGVDLETDDKALNAHNPRLMHLLMKPLGDVQTADASGETDSSKPEFSVDNGGVMMALTVRDKGERALATLMGMTREKAQSSSLTESDAGRVDTKSFVVEDGSAKKHRESLGQQQMKSNWQTKVGAATGGVTTADTGFTCWGCATVVGIACAGAATLSYSSCVSAAFASSVFSPWAGAAVAAFCTYIVTNAGTLSCAVGTAAICSSVSGDCDFLE
jgi:hypothetical protein